MKKVMIRMSEAAYEAAKEEADKVGISCVGTKVGFDINKHYERKAKRQGKEVAK